MRPRLEDYAEQPPEPLKLPELFKRFQSPPFDTDAWVFRGQSYAWPLKPSMERNIDPSLVRLSIIEKQLIREFKGYAQHYTVNTPGEQEELEWLALMQHYGAPTRLLDWSLSPYVAAFFALEQPPQGKPPVIWAINRDHLLSEAWRTMKGDNPPMMPADLERTIWKRRHPFQSPLVLPGRPSKMNERLVAQQGFFLYSEPHSKSFFWSFEDSLRYVLARGTDDKDEKSRALCKLQIDPTERLGLLSELDRMNINYASLFPGLVGFARSLKTKAELLADRWYGTAGRETRY